MTHKLLPALMLFASGLFAQTFPPLGLRDTVLQANSQSAIDLLSMPTGDDTEWVNYDADGKPQTCYSDTTYGWFFAPDAGQDPDTTSNFAFTSCSWLNGSNQINPCNPVNRNRNWLITPPVHLDGEHADLDWKSLSKSGPAYLDGYLVLASTTTNLTDAFTDTLFRAAQMIGQLNSPEYTSVDPADYFFSEGYMQANVYTDTNYFFKVYDPPSMSYYLNGRFEPHHVDLSAYLNQTIYIAFLHNSDCDFILQIDDIFITDDSIVAINAPAAVRKFEVSPNPTTGAAVFTYSLMEAMPARFFLTNAMGQTVWAGPELNATDTEMQIRNDFSWLPAGMYQVILQTSRGRAIRKLIKQ